MPKDHWQAATLRCRYGPYGAPNRVRHYSTDDSASGPRIMRYVVPAGIFGWVKPPGCGWQKYTTRRVTRYSSRDGTTGTWSRFELRGYLLMVPTRAVRYEPVRSTA